MTKQTKNVEFYRKPIRDDGKISQQIPEFRRCRWGGTGANSSVPIGCLLLPVSAGGEVAAEIGVTSLSVPVLSAALWSRWETRGGEGSK